MTEAFRQANTMPEPNWGAEPLLEDDEKKEMWVELYQHLLLEPGFRNLRMGYFSRLKEMILQPTFWRERQVAQFGYTKEKAEAKRLLLVAEISHLLTLTGFALESEIIDLQNNGIHPDQRFPVDKYLTWDEAVTLSGESGPIALVTGSIDPPHIGHSHLIKIAFVNVNKVFVGFSGDSLLHSLKGSVEDVRPRFPLAARMADVASLPTVTGVFVLPIGVDFSQEHFIEIYKSLNVGVLVSGEDNQYLDQYEERMRLIGGRVVTQKPTIYSSTLLMENLKAINADYNLLEEAKRRADALAEKAIRAGYLRDYPLGT